MSNIGAVIGWKFKHQAGMTTKDGSITDFPGGLPSQAEQDLWVAEYEKHLSETAYVALRETAYPPIGDQLDALWKGGQAHTDMKNRIDAVKTAHPKPQR